MSAAVLLSLAAAPIVAQQAEADDPAVYSIDGIVSAVYESISGGIGEARPWDRLRSFYYPDAKVTHTSGLLPDRSPVIAPGSLEDWIEGVQYTEVRGFREIEVARRVEEFGTIAHVFSTYRYTTDDGSMEGGGINSFQLLFDGERYWILSVVWSAETDISKIPERYLSGGSR